MLRNYVKSTERFKNNFSTLIYKSSSKSTQNAVKIICTACTVTTGLSQLKSLHASSHPIYTTSSSQFSTTITTQCNEYITTPSASPNQIPQRDSSTFQYFTPIDAPDADQPMTFSHTVTGKHPYQIAPPPMPTKQFEWSDNVLNFAQKIWTAGFNLETRSQNPFMFGPFHAAHRGKLEVEVFHKLGIGHPVDPEEAGNFITNQIPLGSPLVSHLALPIPGPNGELPVVSTIGICHSGPYSCGPPTKVHGGAIASILDICSYRCVEKSGRKTVTANLNINYRESFPICHEFITATTVRFLGERKALANFVMCDLEMKTVYAEGTGLFITPKGWVGKDSFDYTADTIEFMEQRDAEFHVSGYENLVKS